MGKNERGHQKMSEKVVNAALLGLGTVGTGVYKVIRNQEQEMTAKLGCHFLLLAFDHFIYTGSYCSEAKEGRIYDFFVHFLMSPFRFFQFLSE